MQRIVCPATKSIESVKFVCFDLARASTYYLHSIYRMAYGILLYRSTRYIIITITIATNYSQILFSSHQCCRWSLLDTRLIEVVRLIPSTLYMISKERYFCDMPRLDVDSSEPKSLSKPTWHFHTLDQTSSFRILKILLQ